jgi:3' terminal RNA ribose 2'-O-methyltransferase Hen1
MLLTISAAFKPATDLGYVLCKNPARVQVFELPFGKAHVLYPKAGEDECTACLLLDIDPVGPARNDGPGTIYDYVNDRPYVSSSFLSVAIARVFGTALQGKNKEKPELSAQAIPLTATISALPCRQGAELIERLFEPLGYIVSVTSHELDPKFPEWGEGWYHNVTLTATTTVRQLLSHLYVLIPVLDNEKHYFVGKSEVEKLLKHGEGWLENHPARDAIIRRFLGYKRGLANAAQTQLAESSAEGEGNPEETANCEEQPVASEEAVTSGAESEEAGADPEPTADTAGAEVEPEPTPERLSLHEQRFRAVASVLTSCGAKRIIDLGCGEGKLLVQLAGVEQFAELRGIEVSPRSLEWARRRLRKLDQSQRDKVKVALGSLTYKDTLTQGFDAAVCVEVIEHLDPPRLQAFEKTVFAFARSRTVVVTTPNREYNVLFPKLAAGEFRHSDHRFEWTRAEFRTWGDRVAERFGYTVSYSGIGAEHPEHGAPTQMAVFTLASDAAPLAADGNDGLPSIETVLGKREFPTRLVPDIFVRPGNASAALEAMSRFAVDPRWLVYLPPTMSPSETSQEPGLLEHPAQAFDHFQRHGVSRVVCEEKHMGSRAVVIVCRDQDVARRRFGIVGQGSGICYTRMGRRFFDDRQLESALIEEVRSALTAADFWSQFSTDWVVLDCELMPWSGKAQGLLRKQYASTGSAACASLPDAISALQEALTRGLPVEELLDLHKKRLECANRYRDAYRRYCWPVKSLSDWKLAPFHVLATEGAVHSDKNHVWHMQTLARVAAASSGIVVATAFKVVDLTSAATRAEATAWWEELTASGGEGMVVKPFEFVCHDSVGLVQPAIKCRGKEYLRIIYGPEYTLPGNLERLRKRGLSRKRRLALGEFALGLEALQRFVAGEPLAAVHECVFAVLALETEPVDPRL